MTLGTVILWRPLLMLCFESKSFMLSVYMLNVITLSVFMLNAITLSVFMLGVEVPFLAPPPRVPDTKGAYTFR
jgi:hypothetical protein